MKITRKELRKLITEMARTPIEDPRKDLDLSPEHMKKLQDLVDSGDEETLAQVDAIADSVGGEPYFSGVLARYGVEPIMEEFEFAEPYLSTDQLKHLMLAKGKELVMVFARGGLIGFQTVESTHFIIDPVELHEMVVLVEAKQPQFGGKVLLDDGDYENTVYQSTQHYIDNSTNYYQTLLEFFVAIIRISARTYISEYYAAGFGMGEYGHTADGSYSLHSPFSELQDSSKLFLGYYS